MGSNIIRVMKGQVAAVHGLMFVGVSFTDASRIVGAGPERIRQYIVDDWMPRSRLPIRKKDMTAKERYQHEQCVVALGRAVAIAELKRMMVPPGAAAPNTQEM
jgi:hypothetical protein